MGGCGWDKDHNCAKFRKEKAVGEFMIYDWKYNLKLSQLCKICSDYCRKGDERRKRGGFKDEWY